MAVFRTTSSTATSLSFSKTCSIARSVRRQVYNMLVCCLHLCQGK